MKITADLHIHSRYSRATSTKLTTASLDRWARIKGLQLIGSGDCTHPAWLGELHEQLEPAESGFFTLKPSVRAAFDASNLDLPQPSGEPRFVLTGEISTIYKQGDKTRKVHHVVLLPDFDAAARFQTKIEGAGGNIRSDGRPILGMDSRRLFQLLLDSDPRSILIPAHIWTPWFSALGGKSGFDSIEECYGDLTPLIPAIETGLSSNPPMNWALSSLDKFSVISNSDAHSPDKLAREATVFDMNLDFEAFTAALWRKKPGDILCTLEFYPQEGKYHYDGHRKCGVSQLASGKCPKCGKPLTKGVMGRVLELADRDVDEWAPCPAVYGETNRRPYLSLIPLVELLGEVLGVGPASKRVDAAYKALVQEAGSELALLVDLPVSDIGVLRAPGLDSEQLAEAVARMRAAQVFVEPGYDGAYGVVRVFKEIVNSKEKKEKLFTGEPEVSKPKKPRAAPAKHKPRHKAPDCVTYDGDLALVIAGPGTGKTSAIAERIKRLLKKGAQPSSILAITFTVKAAEELASRTKDITAVTFHSFCAKLLREFSPQLANFSIISETQREKLLKEVCAGTKCGLRSLGNYIERRKCLDKVPVIQKKEVLFQCYQNKKGEKNLDFDDLLAEAVKLLQENPSIRRHCQEHYRYIFVDEYQDVNFAQWSLLKLLFLENNGQKLWVVGDPNQAIYGFRGADKRFIDNFLIDFPKAKQFSLTRSFRCAGPIIAAASALAETKLESARPESEVFLFKEEFATDSGEAECIAKQVSALIGGTSFFAKDSGDAGEGLPVGPEDIVILLRSYALAPCFIKALRDHGLPYVLRGEAPWWEAEAPASLVRALQDIMAEGAAIKLAPRDAVRRVADLHFGYGKKPALVDRLAETAALYSSLEAFLDALALTDSEPQVQGVNIMTMHAAKGLEFDHVFLPALEDGLLPWTIYDTVPKGVLTKLWEEERAEHIAEERRLFYVALTRARQGLYLSWARQRFFQGRTLEKKPSRFIDCLWDLVPTAAPRTSPVQKTRDSQLELFLSAL